MASMGDSETVHIRKRETVCMRGKGICLHVQEEDRLHAEIKLFACQV